LLVVSTSKPHPEPPREGTDPYPSTARVAGTVVNALMFDSTTYDAEYATRITRLLRRIPRSDESDSPAQHGELRPIDVLLLKPSLDLGRLAAEYEHHLPGFFRYLMRGWGTLRSNSSDLMATLLFEAAYTTRLIELGAEDVDRQWSTIERFLAVD
jgi:NTE family protein